MANLYKKNMGAYVSKELEGIIVQSYLEQHQGKKVQTIEGVPCFYEQGQWYRMRSQNMLAEAERMMAKLDPYKDQLVLLFGAGNSILLKKLLTDTREGTKILVLEQNQEVLRYLFSHEDLQEVLASRKFLFVCRDFYLLDVCLQIAGGLGWDNLAHNVQILAMPYFALYNNFMNACVKKVRKGIISSLMALGNDMADVKSGMDHNYKNVDACIKAHGLNEVRGKYEGVTGIIVSAGPSLDKNIELLKQAEGKAVIITTDAAYRACERVGVVPDAIATIEREIPTYRAFYKGRTFDPEVVLLAPPLVWPAILEEFQGEQLLVTKTAAGIEGWWGKQFPQIEQLILGFSCSNAAHAVLEEMGCNPIILIGQDFAYTDNRRHSEDSKYYANNELKEIPQEKWEATAEGIDGKPVRTSRVFNLFRQTMEEMIVRSNRTVIDATEGGAKIAGTVLMNFADAIEKYCVKNKGKNMKACLTPRKIGAAEKRETYERILVAIDKLMMDVDDIEREIANHCKRINKYENMDILQASEEQLNEIVDALSYGNQLTQMVYYEKKDLITYFQQTLKQTIINTKRIGTKVTPENVKRNWELQEFFMYQMEIGTHAIRQQFDEAKAFIQGKLDEVKG